jgi:heme-degrading monooxygenase HmoA
MILEAAILDVIPGREKEFEETFVQASPIIAGMKGYISHQLQHCIEAPSRFLLLVQWDTLESHTMGFRGSPEYQEWKKLLHPFYDPFPVVQHYELILENKN